MGKVGNRIGLVTILSTLLAIAVVATLLADSTVAAPTGDPGSAAVARGARLYDNWWAEAGVAQPKGDQPLWALQTTNQATGSATWRCKECHGWDYKGKDGAYGSGSHKTGFVGVSDAATSKNKEQLVAILKGSPNPQHDFSSVLDDASIDNLADFLKEGLIDVSKFVDYATKKPIGANVTRGKGLYTGSCAPCHGADGTQLNFGSAEKPEYLGTVAAGNPQEFLHKVRGGQPGTTMPAAVVSGWSMQDAVDALAFSQSLPTAKPAVPATPAGAGQRVYDASCARCHGSEARGNLGIPNLAGRHTQQLGIPPEALGPEFVKLMRGGIGGNMPSFPPELLSEEDIGNIGAYLDTVPVPTGEEIYTANCALCHGLKAEGGIGPKLSDADQMLQAREWTREQAAASLSGLVRKGIPGKMPSSAQLTDPEIAGLVDFLTSLGSLLRWEAEFESQHGRKPNDQDRADRAWSLEFATKFGRSPAAADWIARWLEGSR